MGEHTLFFEPDTEILWSAYKGRFTTPELIASVTKIGEAFAPREVRLLVTDLREMSPYMPTDARQAFSASSQGVRIDRQVMIVANPVVRMLAKVILKLDYSAKRAPGRTVFVSTPEEATRYLEDEREKLRAAAPRDDEPPQ